MRLGRANLAKFYDRLASERNRHALERIVVWLSVLGFLAHLLHVALANNLPHPPAIVAAAGRNYLSAIYTPFSFILFYEVLVLIAALPQSTTQSMATQFEIVSLVFIRGFFKEIAKIDMESLRFEEMNIALTGAGAGLAMFLLVAIFRWLGRKRPHEHELTPELVCFIERKKTIALGLTVTFLAMGGFAVAGFVGDALAITAQSSGRLPEPQGTLYSEIFTVMIFTDVLILILSLMVANNYELVFRNAAFVIATILIRFSLTSGYPYGALIGLSGMGFGIVTLAIYNYHARIARMPHP